MGEDDDDGSCPQRGALDPQLPDENPPKEKESKTAKEKEGHGVVGEGPGASASEACSASQPQDPARTDAAAKRIQVAYKEQKGNEIGNKNKKKIKGKEGPKVQKDEKDKKCMDDKDENAKKEAANKIQVAYQGGEE